MYESIQFENFRILRNATLPLGPLTLLVGPNSSGKSTAIAGLELVAQAIRNGGTCQADIESLLSHGTSGPDGDSIRLRLPWRGRDGAMVFEARANRASPRHFQIVARGFSGNLRATRAGAVRVFSALNPVAIRAAATLTRSAVVGSHGESLAVVLDRLRDDSPERFASLNEAVRDWFGEYDAVLFETPDQGTRAITLRKVRSGARVPAESLSEGTLFALVILTLSMLPDPPAVCCFEEPDRGIHPRLLRKVYEALVRLAEPGRFGDSRPAVQVIATTHSPYFVDLFRDRPESIVIAERTDDSATFRRLTDIPHWQEILEGGGSLGDIWFSGVLGGVPAN